MKYFTLSLALAVALPLTAGIRLEMQETDLSDNSVETTELLLEGSRFRVNTSDNSMMFLTAGGRRMVILDKKSNEVREIDQATVDQLAEQLGGLMAQMEAALAGIPPEQRAMMERMMKGKMGPAAQAAAPAREEVKYARSGSATVNGFSCQEYDGTKGGERVVALCAAAPAALKMGANEFAVFGEMQEFVSKLTDALANSPMGGAITVKPITDPGFDGFPVQQTTFVNGKATSRNEVKSATEVTLTDADFSTGNAKKMELIPAGAFGR